MKKLVATILSVSLIGGAMLGLSGCGFFEDDGVDTAFDNAYKATLAKNFTVVASEGSTFEKEKAAAHASEQIWELTTYTYKMDYDNKLVEILATREYFEPAEKKAKDSSSESSSDSSAEDEDIDEFITQQQKGYLFSYQNKYYSVSQYTSSKSDDAEVAWNVNEFKSTKEFMSSMNDMLDSMGDSREALNYVSDMRNLFTKNEETGAYELAMGTTNFKLLANETTVELYEEDTFKKTFEKQVFSEIGTTSVTVPDECKKAIDDYLAKKAAEQTPQA